MKDKKPKVNKTELTQAQLDLLNKGFSPSTLVKESKNDKFSDIYKKSKLNG